jgi:arylsulfatase
MASAPNIVWLFSDQHRADVLGAAGHPVVRTPHLDGLAAEGTLFESAYCQGPLCMPARASLLTGRYVRDHGVVDNRTTLADGLPTMVQAISDAGYHTATIGKMHLYPHLSDVDDGLPVMRGYGFAEVHEIAGKLASGKVRSEYTDHLVRRGLYDTYRDYVFRRAPRTHRPGNSAAPSLPMWTVDPTPLPAEDHIDNWVGERAARWVEATDGRRPFFLWVGFPGPHNPWDAPVEYVDQYRTADIELDTTRRPEVPADGPLKPFLEAFLAYSDSATLTDERIAEVRRHYFANVTLIDAAIGRILGALRERGLDGDTWVVYSTDHGEMLGTHGLFNKMVFYEPSVRVPLIIRPPGGDTAHRFGGLVEHVDLTSTLVELAGAKPIPDAPGQSLAGVLTGEQAPGREVVVSENFGFAMWRTERYKLVVHEPQRLAVQLFDLAADPDENQNLVDDPDHADLVEELMRAQGGHT